MDQAERSGADCRLRGLIKLKRYYDHFGQDWLNNPPVGLVSPDTDRDAGRRTYDYEPHLEHQTGLLISEPPTGKFAVQYAPAHQRRLELVSKVPLD